MSIAPKLQLILDTKAGLKSALNVPNGTPFSQYKNWINWKGATPPSDLLFANYTKDRYSVSGVPASFSDVNEFTRLTAATNFIDGELVEYAANKPRIEAGKGFLVEPSATNYINNNMSSGGTGTTVTPHLTEGYESVEFEVNNNIQAVYFGAVTLTPVPLPNYYTVSCYAIGSASIVEVATAGDAFIPSLSSGKRVYATENLARQVRRAGIYLDVFVDPVRFKMPQLEQGTSPTSWIKTPRTGSATTTRSPDLTRITVPLGKTLTLDADAGVSFIMENATTALITATEPGYIRSARVN